MKLYEIDAALSALINEDTGEVADYEAFEALQMEKERKYENIALAIKNASAEAEAIKAEEKTLASRRKAAENKAERLKSYLAYALGGKKYKSAKVSVSYRKSEGVVVDDDNFIRWATAYDRDDLYRSEPVPNKTAIKAALKDGLKCPFAWVVERENVIVR